MTSSTRQQAWVLLGLVTTDAVAKIVAFHTLPANAPLHQCLTCVVMRVNPLSLGSAAQSVIASQGFHVLVVSAVFSAVLAALLVALAARARLTKRTVALALLAALLSTGAFAVLSPSVSHVTYGATLAARAGAVSLWLVIWALTSSPLWKTGALLFSAAGVSNLLSSAYPPYRVVDYLWSTPLNGVIGIGVFNLADVFWLLGFPIFASALIVSAVRPLYSRPRQSSATRV